MSSQKRKRGGKAQNERAAATAVAMKKSTPPVLTEAQREELQAAFDLIDTDGTGSIDARDLPVALRALGMEPSREEVQQLIAEVSSSPATGSEKIGFEQFSALLAGRLSAHDSDAELLRAFALFDRQKKGLLSVDDLRAVARELGEHVTSEELEQMIAEADTDGDGLVSQQDFVAVMKAK